jgi:microcystin-dependent protein
MEEYLGVIKNFGYPWDTRDFFACDGRLISIQQNPALYSLLGNYFGGDSRSTFAIPDLRPLKPGATAKPDGTYDATMRRPFTNGDIVPHICVEGVYPSRE